MASRPPFGLAVAALSVLAVVLGRIQPSTATSLAADDGDTSAYAAYFGLTAAEAEIDLALTAEARKLQVDLQTEFPGEFGGLWIERDPSFKIVVGMASHREADVRDWASDALDSVLDVRWQPLSLSELEKMAVSLPMPPIGHSIATDVVHNQVVVTVLRGQAELALEQLDTHVRSGSVRVVQTDRLPNPIAEIYGGLHLTYCGGNPGGTSGWSVIKNGTATTGIVTAGHLNDCLSYNGVQLTFKSQSLSGNADAQWHTTSFIEAPKFRWNESGGVRNVTSVYGYSQVVVGDFLCKMGRTTGYDCFTVEAKGVDPDGLFGPLNGVFVRAQACSAPGDIADVGDSGAPVFFSTVSVGIVTHDDGDIFCPNKIIFNSVTHVQSTLGVTIRIAP